MRLSRNILPLVVILLSGCTTSPVIFTAEVTPGVSITPTFAATSSPVPLLSPPPATATAAEAANAPPEPSLSPTQSSPTPTSESWQSLPVIPEIPPRVVEIYQLGLELGNNPVAFSKVGDCGSTPAWFLGDFDRGPRYYRLGAYQSLEEVILAFQGSFGRTSLAAKAGFNASSVFTSLWADRSQCDSNEMPLACEYRLQRPILAFIMLGSNDVWHKDSFEPQMRKIIEFSIERGVIPVLSTKADNDEGDGSLNATIARLAQEYHVPMLNYWLAVQPLPDYGLQEDGVHITWAPNRFDDAQVMEHGWPVRNLTALQILDAVWRKVTGQP